MSTTRGSSRGRSRGRGRGRATRTIDDNGFPHLSFADAEPYEFTARDKAALTLAIQTYGTKWSAIRDMYFPQLDTKVVQNFCNYNLKDVIEKVTNHEVQSALSKFNKEITKIPMEEKTKESVEPEDRKQTHLFQRFAMPPAQLISSKTHYYVLYRTDRATTVTVKADVNEGGLLLVITSAPISSREWDLTEASKYCPRPRTENRIGFVGVPIPKDAFLEDISRKDYDTPVGRLV